MVFNIPWAVVHTTVFFVDRARHMIYAEHMLTGLRIFSSDAVWRGILADLGATVVDAPNVADVNLDDIAPDSPVGVTELKAAILAAGDNGDIISRVCGSNVCLPRGQARIIVALYKSAGGLTSAELKTALGYSPDAATHAIEAAIYQLRKRYGRDFIRNQNGVYVIGKV